MKVPFAQKSVLLVKQGMTGATGNIYCGLHEFKDMSFLLHFLRPEDKFLDVGANIGSYTVLASSEIGCQSTAVEPVPIAFNAMTQNIAANQIGNLVRATNVGLSHESGVLNFSSGLDTVNHVVLNGTNTSTIQVQVVTMDELCGDRTPTLIKMDVEGYELSALKGGISILSNTELKALIIELNGSGERYGIDDAQVHSFLTKHGFEPFDYDPFERQLVSIDAPGAHNTIYIRDIEFVSDRVKKATDIRIHGLNY